MQNFTLFNPTKLHFGKGKVAKLQEELTTPQNILIIYGGGSIKKNGAYAQVVANLQAKKHNIFEFYGIEPNPEYETCLQAVEMIKKEKIDFVIAIGGGSVIDATKFIVSARYFDGEPWDILSKNADVKKTMPFGTVLTLPATGSEMNCGAVVSRREISSKRSFRSPLVFPQFSILDPEFTFSLPTKQTINGIIDAFTHVMEQYLTYNVNSPIQDRFAESILQTLIEEGPKVLAHPTDYEARANLMYSATWALNTFIGSGVPGDWATHVIGHELTALYGLDHAVTLSIVLPSLMEYKRTTKGDKIVQYAQRVWGISNKDKEQTITQAIAKTREFFESLGRKTHLSQHDVDTTKINQVKKSLERHELLAIGEHRDITPQDCLNILEKSI